MIWLSLWKHCPPRSALYPSILLLQELQVSLIDYEGFELNGDLKWNAQRRFTNGLATLLHVKATFERSQSFGERMLQ
jgi:hypothetical protein